MWDMPPKIGFIVRTGLPSVAHTKILPEIGCFLQIRTLRFTQRLKAVSNHPHENIHVDMEVSPTCAINQWC